MNNNKRSIGLSQDTTFFLKRPSGNKITPKPKEESSEEEQQVMQHNKVEQSKGKITEVSSASMSSSSVIEIEDFMPQTSVPEVKKAKIVKSPSILDNLDPELLALISSSSDEAAPVSSEDNKLVSLKVEVRINNESVCLKTIVFRLGYREPFRKCLEELSRSIKMSLSQLILCTPHGVRVYPSSTPEILGTVDDAVFHLLDLRGYDTRKYRMQNEIEKAIAKKSSNENAPLDDVVDTEQAPEAQPDTIRILVKSKDSQAKQVTIKTDIPLLPQILAQMEADGKCRFDGQIINSSVTANNLEVELDDLVDFIPKL